MKSVYQIQTMKFIDTKRYQLKVRAMCRTLKCAHQTLFISTDLNM